MYVCVRAFTWMGEVHSINSEYGTPYLARCHILSSPSFPESGPDQPYGSVTYRKLLNYYLTKNILGKHVLMIRYSLRYNLRKM